MWFLLDLIKLYILTLLKLLVSCALHEIVSEALKDDTYNYSWPSMITIKQNHWLNIAQYTILKMLSLKYCPVGCAGIMHV